MPLVRFKVYVVVVRRPFLTAPNGDIYAAAQGAFDHRWIMKPDLVWWPWETIADHY